MPSVTIDSGVLAVPPSDCDEETAYQYVDALLDWRVLLSEPWVAIYMSENTCQLLFDEGLYPLRDHLRELFRVHGIDTYDVNTVARVVDNLLELTPSFETFFRLKDVLFDQVNTEPDILQFSTWKGLESDLARCVILIAILRNHCREPVQDHSLILRHSSARCVTVQAMIHDIEHNRDDIVDVPKAPSFFRGDVLVCADFRGLINCLDAPAVLVASSDDVGVETAIRIALYKSRLERGLEPDWSDIGRLRLGKEFAERFRRVCADADTSLPDRALRAIVETIEKVNLAATHALRTSPGGGAAQKTRGEDKAWRRDIDKQYHIHYWECADDTVELASLGVHNDFSIPG